MTIKTDEEIKQDVMKYADDRVRDIVYGVLFIFIFGASLFVLGIVHYFITGEETIFNSILIIVGGIIMALMIIYIPIFGGSR